MRYSGDYGTKVPPLPIPNREVKLRHADGTAYSGRVGSRRLNRDPEVEILQGFFVSVLSVRLCLRPFPLLPRQASSLC